MRVLLFALSLLLCSSVLGQTNSVKPVQNKVPQKVNAVSGSQTYELYPTENMWNFLKLNTVTGQIWVVQYSVQSTNTQIQVPLSQTDLLWKDEAHVNGRFKLYPTENMWTFILLDQINGNVWQVQWSTDPNNMGLMKIKER